MHYRATIWHDFAARPMNWRAQCSVSARMSIARTELLRRRVHKARHPKATPAPLKASTAKCNKEVLNELPVAEPQATHSTRLYFLRKRHLWLLIIKIITRY